MFCYQCEQTDRTREQLGCAALKANCGKDDKTAALQDLLVHACYGVAQYARRSRQLGAPDRTAAAFVTRALFGTLTNVNFDAERFVALLAEADEVRERARGRYEQALREQGLAPSQLSGPAALALASGLEALAAQGRTVPVDAGQEALGPDIVGLRNLNLYGLKGICAYAYHAGALGYSSDELDGGIEAALDFLADGPADAGTLLDYSLSLGHLNLKAMSLLDEANTDTFGHPVPTAVRVGPIPGKAVLVSGHDLADLRAVLEATAGTGVNVYTHGELLPAHGYPGLHKYGHLVGNYGGAWQDQQADFVAFPGPVVMTSNCLIQPRRAYQDRVFTMGPVGWPGVEHISADELGRVVASALAGPGFAVKGADDTITVGFARKSVLDVAGSVVDAVKSGAISRFLLIGGCDGAAPGRGYFAEVADQAPGDTVVLTLGCGKFRFNRHEFGDIGGIPRLLDIGQCNDAYSAVQIATALAGAFECGVNDLPLSFFVSWFEQKAVAVLLSLLALGVRNIRLGPTLPAFLTPAAIEVLVDKFALKPALDPAADLAAAMAGH
jgi:hydroxylamine reductase